MPLDGIFNCQSLEIAFPLPIPSRRIIHTKKKKKKKKNSIPPSGKFRSLTNSLEKETFDTESWKTLGLVKYHLVAK